MQPSMTPEQYGAWATAYHQHYGIPPPLPPPPPHHHAAVSHQSGLPVTPSAFYHRPLQQPSRPIHPSQSFFLPKSIIPPITQNEPIPAAELSSADSSSPGQSEGVRRTNDASSIGLAPIESNTEYYRQNDDAIATTNDVTVLNSIDNVATTATVRAIASTDAKSRVSFDSVQKIGLVVTGVMFLCYCSVSPRSLPLAEYNARFQQNIEIVSLAFIAPLLILISVFDARENDANAVVRSL